MNDGAVDIDPDAAFDWRASLSRERIFLGACALVFIAGSWITIETCQPMSDGMEMPGGWTMSMAWMRMDGESWLAAATSFLGMWVAMMVAMMMPSLVAMLLCYRRAIRRHSGRRMAGLTAISAGAYFLVWTLAGLVVYPIGASVAAAEMRLPALEHFVPLAGGIVLLLAGVIQLTPWKSRRLMRCREAPACGTIVPDPRGAWRHGLRLGVDCSLCCAGLMTVLIVTGVMSVAGMAVVAAAITAERFAYNPGWTARTIGIVIIVYGLVVIAVPMI
ncbi:MAG TPA: DUF2182 domain-containing protein [Verrucomicrobiae bacterium]|jgi:predicted metal-binding membrane protein|nr:DUF2182 domain-containing protein [Verrucomicrobiae bacterium]